MGVTLLEGQELGHWTLEEQLGQGGMAVVYRASHRFIPERKAAIKMLFHTADPTSLERFRREASAINAIQHKHIVQLIDFGYDEELGTYYMVQELLEGYDLKELLLQQMPLPKQLVWQLTEQICEGLQVVHDAHLVHRDLKPSNIFLLPNKKPHPLVKILDFGIAKSVVEDNQITGISRRSPLQINDFSSTSPDLTGEQIIGTPKYLSPEQAQAEEITHLSDIYAFGVVLYEMLTGHVPISGRSIVTHTMSLIREDRPKAGSFRQELQDTALEDLLFRMVQLDPTKRPCSVKEVLEELSIALAAFEDPLDEKEQHPGPLPRFATKQMAAWSDEALEAISSDTDDSIAFDDTGHMSAALRNRQPGESTTGNMLLASSPEGISTTLQDPAEHGEPQASRDTSPLSADTHERLRLAVQDRGSTLQTGESQERHSQPQEGTNTTRKQLRMLLIALVVGGIIAGITGIWMGGRTRSLTGVTCLGQALIKSKKRRLRNTIKGFHKRVAHYYYNSPKATGTEQEQTKQLGGVLAVWTLGQASLGLAPQLNPDKAQKVGQLLLKMRFKGCACYPRLTGNIDPSLFVTAWATLGLLTIDANTFRKGINEQLAFLARHQKPAGFWAVHPQASDAKANAALYPTLLSMWAFHLALTKAKALQLPTATVAQLKAGKQRAVAWLLAAKPGDQPFWKPYPYNPNNTPSSSISGMALTILSQMKLPAKTMQPLASQWVDEILKTPPPRLSGMGSQDLHPDLHVRLKKALTSDSTRYLKLPWHLAAADASFPHLTDEQKHKLIDYIETAITHFPKAKLEPPFRLAIGLFGVRQLTCNINR